MKKTWLGKIGSRYIILVTIGLIIFITCFIILPKENYEETMIKNFVKENLRDEYILPNLTIKNKLISTNETTGTDNLYGAVWSVQGIEFWVGMHYNLYDRNITDLKIFIIPPQTLENIDEDIALSISKKYFKDVKEDSLNCEYFGNVTFCENFWMNQNKNKIGVGVIVYNNSEVQQFLCAHPPGSEHYEWKSCAEQFK